MKTAQKVARLLELMAEDVCHRVAEQVVERTRPAEEKVVGEMARKAWALGLEPLRVLSAKEVAKMIGTTRVASVYDIPEDELPRVRRIGTQFGYYTINVLCYMHSMPPIDVPALIESYERNLKRHLGRDELDHVRNRSDGPEESRQRKRRRLI